MPSTFETGHAKNVANFETLISFCVGYGATYNPSRDALKVANLQTLLTDAKAVIVDCKAKETAFDNATDARKESFSTLKALGTRVVNALSVSGVADSVVEGARTINRKLQGQRANGSVTSEPVSTESGTPAPSTASSSQQSYDNLVEHFNGLIELVSSHTEYNPNETELKVATLQTYSTELRTANTNVQNANTDWSNSRISRDKTLYADKTGLVDIALDVKAYVKSVFNSTSPQYGQISGIEFKRAKV
jgi:hypothetical protein